MSDQYSFNTIEYENMGKRTLCSLFSFTLSILFLFVSGYWLLNGPMVTNYYNVIERIPISLPDQQIFIDTNNFFACECEMYNITFNIISPYSFSVTSNQTFNMTNIIHDNGAYYANITDNNVDGVEYFDMTISLYTSNQHNILGNILGNITIHGSYGTQVISPIALVYSIPIIISLIIMCYSFYMLIYVCRKRKIIRNDYMTTTLVFSI